MSIAKAHLVSFSPCGGTRNVNAALCRDIELPLLSHDWTLPASREDLTFGPDDLVFLAFPVYGGRMPRNIDLLFAKLHGRDTPAALIAVYGNREFEGALLDLHAAAVANGFLPVAAVAAVAEHSMASQVATGRPDVADRETLAEFGRIILDRSRKGQRLDMAPGAYPDWKLPEGVHLFPVSDPEKCVSCGNCADICPAEAIPAQNPLNTDYEKCIVCGACAKYCPAQARSMGSQKSREMVASHIATCLARRKEPEIFC